MGQTYEWDQLDQWDREKGNVVRGRLGEEEIWRGEKWSHIDLGNRS